MPLDYRYEAVDAAGRRLNGTLTADSEKDARRKLFEQGFRVKPRRRRTGIGVVFSISR